MWEDISVMMTSLFASLAVFYLFLSWVWLRRAYVGEKALLFVTLSQPRGERESSGNRVFQALLGLACLAMGLAWVLPLLWNSHRFHWPKF